MSIGEYSFWVEKNLRTAVAKLETDEELTEKETVAVAIAAGCLINECSEEGGQLRITTEPVGIVKCGDKFRVFTQRETLFGEDAIESFENDVKTKH